MCHVLVISKKKTFILMVIQWLCKKMFADLMSLLGVCQLQCQFRYFQNKNVEGTTL